MSDYRFVDFPVSFFMWVASLTSFLLYFYIHYLYFSKVILQGKFRHFSLYSDPSQVVFILQDLQ